MRTMMPSCPKVYWAAPLLLALLLAGCVGQKRPGLALVADRKDARIAAGACYPGDFRRAGVEVREAGARGFLRRVGVGPCKKLGPVLEDFALAHPEVRVVKVNVDENSELAGRYEVKAMPSLLVIRGGQVTSRSLGWSRKRSWRR